MDFSTVLGPLASFPSSPSQALDALPADQWAEAEAAFRASKRGAAVLESERRKNLMIGSAAGLVVGAAVALLMR